MSNISIPSSNRLLIKPRGMFSIGGESGDSNSITQNFDDYTPAVPLSTLPGWTVVGIFYTVAGGGATSAGSGNSGVAAYEPAGFVTSANHESEVTLKGAAAGAGSAFQGCAVAIQPSGNAYWLGLDNTGILYFGYNSGGGVSSFISVTLAAGVAAGTKLKLSVKGAGAARRVTAMYNIGGGWVTPPGWLDRDFGAGLYLDGGKAGIEGFDNSGLVVIDSLTIRNLP